MRLLPDIDQKVPELRCIGAVFSRKSWDKPHVGYVNEMPESHGM